MPRDGPSPRSDARPATTGDARDRRAAFARQVRDALSHLYDPVYLQTHPLARLVAREPDARPPGAGQAVRQVLREAIAALHPLTGTTNALLAGASYQILHLRYVEGLDVPAIQSRLALGKSEYYREQQHGVDALVSLLWEGWQGTPPPVATPATSAEPAPPRRRHNLPTPTTTYIPRAGELVQVAQRLRETRLLTLTGAGGCGKTRLAQEVARVVLEEFADGVWLVELAPLTDPTLVPQAVATTLDVRETPGRPLLTTLADYLCDKPALLLVDNCEHLINASAHLADTLLAVCPRLRILVTSREVLGVPGEAIWRVPSLSLPSLSQPIAAAALSESEAARLFLDRAQAARPGFALTDRNAPAVTQICARLDGIPLALELAAARLRVLTVEQIAGRLDDRLRLLTGGSRTALRRQQTLQATIDWSYELLTETERGLLRRLAVFAGGWTLETAEAVGGGEDLPAADVLDRLGALVDKSLVVAEGEGAHARYRLLETIRQYAGEKLLEADEGGPVRDRHRAWYAELAARAEPEVNGPEQEEWLGRLEAEHDNLRAALAWSLEGDPGAGLRLAASLGWFWSRHGHLVEGRRWLEVFLARAPAPDNPEKRRMRARALRRAGSFASDQQDRAAAGTFLAESLTLFRALGDQPRVAAALNTQGMELLRAGAPAEQIRSILEESLGLWRALANGGGVANTLWILSFLAARERDDAGARRLMDEALALARASGNHHLVLLIFVERGWFAWGQGNLASARRDLEEGLGIGRRLGLKDGIGLALLTLGCLALEEGERDRARASLEESARLLREAGLSWAFYLGLAYLGHRAIDRGRHAPGVRLLAAVEAGYPHYDVLAFLQPLVHPAERAKATDVARAALGEEAFAAAWAAGQAMNLESAVELALAEGE